jgi:hypothetical protein
MMPPVHGGFAMFPAFSARPLVRAVLLLLLLVVTGCGGPLLEREYSFRYRITVEVETPEGVRTASAVREVTLVQPPDWEIFSGGARRELRGEAVAIDLPGGRTLFALLGPPMDEAAYMPFQLFDELLAQVDQIEDPNRNRPDHQKRIGYLNRERPSAEVTGDLLPDFVYFTNPADPTTVQLADHANLEETFGEGYRLKRVSIAVTDAPVTVSIARRLPWLDTIERGRLIGFSPEERAGRSDVLGITIHLFRRGRLR